VKHTRVACVLIDDFEHLGGIEDVRKARIDQGLELLDEAGRRHADIALLSEAWTESAKGTVYEPRDHPRMAAIAEVARRHNMIVVAHLEELGQDGNKYNSALVYGRYGNLLGSYCKNIPFWAEVGVVPGTEVCAFDTDAGRFGVLICFESQWPDLWMEMGALDVDMVFWISAYSGGCKLIAPAIYNNYYVVSCTWVADTHVVDINGEVVRYAKGGDQVVIHELDLDRTMVHDNFNGQALADIRRVMGDRIKMSYMPKEGWWVVESNDPALSVKKLLKERGVETLREYTRRSRSEIYELRSKGQPLPPLPSSDEVTPE